MPGMSCMSPCAPARDRAVVLKPLSCWITAATRFGDMPYFPAISVMSRRIAVGAFASAPVMVPLSAPEATLRVAVPVWVAFFRASASAFAASASSFAVTWSSW